MTQTQSPKPRPLTPERRRTLAYLLVAEAMGYDVRREFDDLPSDAEDSYEALAVRADIRCHYAHEPEHSKFKRQVNDMLTEFDQGQTTDEMRMLYDWMVEHIVFPEWDDENFRKYWNFAAFKQRQKRAKQK